MASRTFNNFKAYATLLEKELGIKYDAKPYKETIRIMLDGFCKAMDEHDEHLKTLYISGLILRHWDKVKKLADSCPNVDIKGEEFVDWVYEAIVLACDYRKWQKDPTVNAQQCVNQCIETVRVRHYYDYNLDKRKANYNVISLDNPIGDCDDGAQRTLMDTMSDEAAESAIESAYANDAARRVVQSFIDRDRIVEAIILDIIAFGDTERVVKKTSRGVDENGEEYKYSTYTREFWKFKAVQALSELPDDYSEYFLDNYVVKKAALEAAIGVLKRANNNKLTAS